MDDIFMKSVIEKVDSQENKIAGIEAAIKNLLGYKEGIENIRNAVDSIKGIAEGIPFPIQEMRELSRTVTECRKQLSQPVQNTVQHHHHFPKILWLSIGLIVALAIVCSGWYLTADSLAEYKANDTKYRYLKVFGNNSLKEMLFETDSLYSAFPNMRDSVIQKENENRERFEMLEKANSKEKEAKELRKKAKKL